MIFVDGNALKTDPIPLLNRFQKQIDLEDFVDFKKLIQFDNKKGFYCPIQNGKSQCLGISKVTNATISASHWLKIIGSQIPRNGCEIARVPQRILRRKQLGAKSTIGETFQGGPVLDNLNCDSGRDKH